MPFDDTETPADVPAANDPEGAEVSYTYGGSDSASFKFVKDPTGECSCWRVANQSSARL